MPDRLGLKQPFPGHWCELPPTAPRIYPALAPNANLIQRVKRLVLPVVLPWNQDRRFRILRRSNYAREFDQARQAHTSSWWIVHPYSCFQMSWHVVMIVVISISIFYKPFVFAFINVYSIAGIDCPVTDVSEILQEIRLFLDILFMFHILFTFNTGYVQQQNNVVVMSRHMIAKRYVKSWFVPDVCSVFPINIFFQTILKKNSVKYTDFMTLPFRIFSAVLYVYEIPTLLRIFGLLARIRVVMHHRGIPDYICRWVRVSIVVIAFVHWMSCAHFSIPVLIHGNFASDYRSYSWLSRLNVTHKLCGHYGLHYLLALFRTLSFIQGFGFMIPIEWTDTILFLINGWVGFALLAYFSALLLNVLQVHAESSITFERTIRELKLYMTSKKMPLAMRQRLLQYYHYQLQSSNFNERTILASLPLPLRNDIKTHCCRRLVTNAAIFKNISKSLVLSIMRELKDVVYLQHDVIYCEGMTGKCMYFVSSGTLMALLPTGEEIGHYSEGSYFGETEMMHSSSRRKMSVVALETCELYRLDKSTFHRLIAPMPRLHARLRLHANSYEKRILARIRRSIRKSEMEKKESSKTKDGEKPSEAVKRGETADDQANKKNKR